MMSQLHNVSYLYGGCSLACHVGFYPARLVTVVMLLEDLHEPPGERGSRLGL